MRKWRDLIVATGVFGGLWIFAWYVWPTPYEYGVGWMETEHVDCVQFEWRTNRLTGTTQHRHEGNRWDDY
jgi:hypothetical protein